MSLDWLRFGMGEQQAGVERRAASLESIAVSATPAEFFSFFGLDSSRVPAVTVESALQLAPVGSAVNFLSRTLAALPLQLFKTSDGVSQKVSGGLATILHDAPNDYWSSQRWRAYFWQGVFTHGRGLSWIEKSGTNIINIWPMDPSRTRVQRKAGRVSYILDGRTYDTAEVIDIPFALKADGVGARSPIQMGAKAIALGLSMQDYGASFFAGGGVPPLALTGPMPNGAVAMGRALSDMKRSIDQARETQSPIFMIPPGHTLAPVGFEPQKGQLGEGLRFMVEEISRLYSLPPVFLQDLSRGTFSNTEQQGLNLTKHTLTEWVTAFEQELNLKLFGRRNTGRYVKHNMDGMLRGAFKDRTEGIARAIQTGQLTPNEARALDERGPLPGGARLYIQGATVPLQTIDDEPGDRPPAGDNADGS